MPLPASRNVHKVEDIIVKVVDLETEIHRNLDRLAEIHNIINTMADPFHQAVLVKRYVDGEAWKCIAVDLRVSLRRVYQLHDAALADVESILAERLH
jgi:DNA-directed RNA polymerase specialized sigma subunit